jgi:hypothetical protein
MEIIMSEILLLKFRRFSYGTKTALYSCSRHITHISGIRRSLLAASDSSSAFSFKPEMSCNFQYHIETEYE